MNKKIIMLATTIMLITTSFAKTEECKSGFKGFTAGVTVGYQAQQAKTHQTKNPGSITGESKVYKYTKLGGTGTWTSNNTQELYTAIVSNVSPTLCANFQNLNFGLNLGYGYVKDKLYIGGQLYGDISPGKMTVHKYLSAQYRSYVIGNTPILYGQLMPVINTKATLKATYSGGIGVKLGYTEGALLFYVPLNLTVTKYTAKYMQNSDLVGQYGTISSPVEAIIPSINKIDEDSGTVTITKVTGVQPTGQTASATTGDYTQNKTKINYAFGLGVAMKITEKISVDLCYTYSPTTKLNINKPAYQTPVYYDVQQLGLVNTIKVSSQKFALGVTWHI